MKRQINSFLVFLGISVPLKCTIRAIKIKAKHVKNKLFNAEVRSQEKNYRSIPIIIISFNQLYYLKQLVEFLQKNHYSNIVIVDNHSTYQPLLDYFDSIGKTITIHRLQENAGHLVFWKNKAIFEQYSNGYFAVTDADIVPVEACPEDFLLKFKRILDSTLQVNKVGFSLKIDDIPDSNSNKEKVINWESKFWTEKRKDGHFLTDIDTTFAIYRPGFSHVGDDFYKAVRTNFPYQARHGGWYINNNELTEEQQNYFNTCNDSSSWRINNSGEISKKNYNN